MTKKFGIVSGYFNPLHAGHLDYINHAKRDCDFLIAIVNSDLQVDLKNSKRFMDESHRLLIINNIKSIDYSLVSVDRDLTVTNTLAKIKNIFPNPDFKFCFYNSGDRSPDNTNKEEEDACENLGIDIKFLDLPKIYSSRNFK